MKVENNVGYMREHFFPQVANNLSQEAIDETSSVGEEEEDIPFLEGDRKMVDLAHSLQDGKFSRFHALEPGLTLLMFLMCDGEIGFGVLGWEYIHDLAPSDYCDLERENQLVCSLNRYYYSHQNNKDHGLDSQHQERLGSSTDVGYYDTRVSPAK